VVDARILLQLNNPMAAGGAFQLFLPVQVTAGFEAPATGNGSVPQPALRAQITHLTCMVLGATVPCEQWRADSGACGRMAAWNSTPIIMASICNQCSIPTGNTKNSLCTKMRENKCLNPRVFPPIILSRNHGPADTTTLPTASGLAGAATAWAGGFPRITDEPVFLTFSLTLSLRGGGAAYQARCRMEGHHSSHM
jgi:hypothetical protein